MCLKSEFFTMSLHVLCICFPLVFSGLFHFIHDKVQNPLIELSLSQTQPAAKDVKVGEGTGDVKECVEDISPSFHLMDKTIRIIFSRPKKHSTKTRLDRSGSCSSSQMTIVWTS